MHIELKRQIFFVRRSGVCIKKMYFGRWPMGGKISGGFAQAFEKTRKNDAAEGLARRLLILGARPGANQGGENERQKKNSHRR
jgi:hypothetical protein